MSGVGSLNEGHLHASLKAQYAGPGAAVEVPVEGFVVDVLGPDQVVEIQTSGFSRIARKLRTLVATHRVLLVHPIRFQYWIVKTGAAANKRRKSPKRRGFEDVFAELVSFPDLLREPNFEIEVVGTFEEEIRRPLPNGRRRGRWKKDWVVEERRLLEVRGTRRLCGPEDLLDLLPGGLPDPFGTSDLATGLGCSRALAQRAAYCLRESGAATVVGKSGNALLYSTA